MAILACALVAELAAPTVQAQRNVTALDVRLGVSLATAWWAVAAQPSCAKASGALRLQPSGLGRVGVGPPSALRRRSFLAGCGH